MATKGRLDSSGKHDINLPVVGTSDGNAKRSVIKLVVEKNFSNHIETFRYRYNFDLK